MIEQSGAVEGAGDYHKEHNRSRRGAGQRRAIFEGAAGLPRNADRNAFRGMAITVDERVVATDIDGARNTARGKRDVPLRGFREERSAPSRGPSAVLNVPAALVEGESLEARAHRHAL